MVDRFGDARGESVGGGGDLGEDALTDKGNYSGAENYRENFYDLEAFFNELPEGGGGGEKGVNGAAGKSEK